MANGEEMLALADNKEISALSIIDILEQSLNEKVDELLELQKRITKDLEKIIEKLSV